MEAPLYSAHKTVLNNLIQKSESVIKPWFASRSLEIEHKSDATPVTIADREAEAAMRKIISSTFPDHGIIGEEFGSTNPEADYVWVLDPIDGTVTFASGCPLFGTLIGLLHKGKPVLGAINLPALGQCYIGDNQTTTLNGTIVKMRPALPFEETTVLCTCIKSVDEYQSREQFDALLARTHLFRTWGDCYGYTLLAGGWADIMLDPIMNPWDIIALIPVIRGAGGVITTWDGKDPVAGDSIIAARPEHHSEVLQIFNDCRVS